MLTLLSPAALWSLAALSLPLAIHLWRQPPRTVRLPSLRFLRPNAGRHLQDLRWRERLLLLTRLGLLTVLSLLLAQPRWQHLPPRGPQCWLLLDPNAAPAAASLARLRTLQTAGYATHLLAPGLPVFNRFPAASADLSAPDLWSLLREADAILPAGSTLAVFSPARLATLRGPRPALRAKIEWVKTPDLAGDAPHVWLNAIRPSLAPTHPPSVTIGVSNATATRFTASPPARWKLQTRPDAARLLSPDGHAAPWTAVLPSAPLSVLILHDAARTEDAHYLAAALRAAVSATGFPLDLRSADAATAPASLTTTDWTFWLADSPPSAGITTRTTRLLQDAPHPDKPSTDWIVPQPETPGAAILTPAIRLWQRGTPPVGTPLWTDAHGSPLLTFTHSPTGPRWHFASRFHPAWTDLPLTTVFPAWLQSLLLPTPPTDPRHDFRLAAASQAQPSTAAPATVPPAVLPPASVPIDDLHWSLWNLAALLFCLERLLSHRRRLTPASTTTPRRPEPVPAR